MERRIGLLFVVSEKENGWEEFGGVGRDYSM